MQSLKAWNILRVWHFFVITQSVILSFIWPGFTENSLEVGVLGIHHDQPAIAT